MEDLQALRNLYRLVQPNDHLNDTERLLLKELLDSAAEKILFDSHSSINVGATNSDFTKMKSIRQNLRPPLSSINFSKPSLCGIQTANTEFMDFIHENGGKFSHRNNPTEPSETQSNYEFGISPSKLQSSQKRCRVCQRCIIKPESTSNNCGRKGGNNVGYESLSGTHQLHSARLTSEPKGDRVYDVQEPFIRITSRQVEGNQSNAEELEESRSTTSLSKKVADSIKRIETGILTLQLNSQNAIPTSCSTSGIATSENYMSSSVARPKQEAGCGFDVNETGEQKLPVLNRTNSPMDEDMESLASAATRFTNVRDMVARIESMNQEPNQIGEPKHVSILQKHDQIVKKSGILMKAKPSMPQKQSDGHTNKDRQAQQRFFPGPTLLNYESQHNIRTTSRPRAQRKHGKMILHQEISSSTTPSSQRSSIFSSSIEPSETGESREMTSSNDSSRSVDSLRHGLRNYRPSDESNTEEDSDSIISSTASASYYSTDEDPPPGRRQRRTYDRSESSVSETRRGTGRLRRLKNKLGLIFHHHHHHHHHHHQYPDTTNDYATKYSKSQWKNLQKMVFHHKEGSKKSHSHVKTEPKSSRSLVSKKKTKNEFAQMGQFHALAKGMVRHVRNYPKKSKSDHSKKKKSLLRSKQQPKSTGKVKLGFKRKKPAQLKVLRR